MLLALLSSPCRLRRGSRAPWRSISGSPVPFFELLLPLLLPTLLLLARRGRSAHQFWGSRVRGGRRRRRRRPSRFPISALRCRHTLPLLYLFFLCCLSFCLANLLCVSAECGGEARARAAKLTGKRFEFSICYLSEMKRRNYLFLAVYR